MTDNSIFEEGTIELTDENGKGYEFRLLDLIQYKGAEYAVLFPKNDANGSVTVLRVEDVNGDDIADYISVQDPGTVAAVFEIFKNKVKEAEKESGI
ncbi:MAG: DUF1292 domain-containing protein [Clostridia bacterium]|nr:DUF1292 domain-containing protein [Clostridia bacterium]